MRERSYRNAGLVLAVIIVAVTGAAPAFASSLAGTAPPGAGTGVGNWQPLSSQPIEFDLAYAGNNEAAIVELAADPANAAGFNVYTDQQWQAIAAGNTNVTPIGRGSPNSYASGHLVWKAGASTPSLFHIQVYPTTANAARFWIAQTGWGSSVLYQASGGSGGGIVLIGPGCTVPLDRPVVKPYRPAPPPPPVRRYVAPRRR